MGVHNGHGTFGRGSSKCHGVAPELRWPEQTIEVVAAPDDERCDLQFFAMERLKPLQIAGDSKQIMVLDKIAQRKLLRRRGYRQTEDEKRMRSETHDAVLSLLKGSCVGTGGRFLRRSYFLLISSLSRLRTTESVLVDPAVPVFRKDARTRPNRISSPGRAAVADSIRRPLRYVPFLLSRSSTVVSLPAISRRAWWRDT